MFGGGQSARKSLQPEVLNAPVHRRAARVAPLLQFFAHADVPCVVEKESTLH